MAYDARIILAQQPLNALAAIQGGTEAAAGQNAFARQAAYQKMLQQNGPGIMSGDRNALNAFAMFDPAAAMGMQESRLNMEAKRQSMDILSAEEKRRVSEHAAGLSASEREAQARQIEDAVKMGLMAQSPEQYDALMQQMGQPNLVGTFDQRQALAARAMSMADVLKRVFPEPQKPADEYGRYVAEETAAGRQPLDRIGFEQAKKGKGLTFTTGPDGTTTFSMGGEAGPGTTVGQVYNPNEVASVVALIDQIDKDPNLPSVLGNKAVVLGGGNMVGEMNLPQRLGYGQGGLSVIEKIGQLQSNAWLSARAMLKGGGAITDYESKKAEAAVARLERPKSEADFRAALKELRDAITEGEAKLRGAAPQPAAPPAQPAAPAASTATKRLRFNPATGELEEVQ